MKCNVINVMLGLFVCVLFSITGCGSGGSASTPDANKTADLTGFGWLFENTAPDYLSDGSTCSLNVNLYYSGPVAKDDIESFRVTSPTGWYWTVASSNSHFGTSSTGRPYIGARLVFGQNRQTFPLAGVWTVELKLKNGNYSSLQRTLHEPGSTADATHGFLYTKEDSTRSTDDSQYIAALGRFPSQGYGVQYSATGGGMITTTGLHGVRSSFLAAEPNAFNMYCWLYDANKVYLGYTITEYSTLNHSSSNLIGSDGELSILPASVMSTSGQVDLSRVKFIRFVVLDGAQFVPSSYSNADYRSVSYLIPVN
jgi:predicted small lipoprotein YifL